MALLVSTNMYKAEDIKRVIDILKKFQGAVGVEVFPMFHHKGYEGLLQECLPEFSKVPVSFHEPYYQADHSAVNGTEIYEKTMDMMKLTCIYASALHSRYVVFHHNNGRLLEGRESIMKEVACMHYRETERMLRLRNIPVLVENAGVKERGNMLYDQEEFIKLCREEDYQVLIDIGHAHANGWDLPCVMEELKGRIKAYHLHNNDGYHDSHQRIRNGTLDFDRFLENCRRFTPNADMVMEYSIEAEADRDGIEEDIRNLLTWTEAL